MSACETLGWHCLDLFSSIPFECFSLIAQIFQIFFRHQYCVHFAPPIFWTWFVAFYRSQYCVHFAPPIFWTWFVAFYRSQYCVHFAPPTYWTWFVSLSFHWDCHILSGDWNVSACETIYYFDYAWLILIKQCFSLFFSFKSYYLSWDCVHCAQPAYWTWFFALSILWDFVNDKIVSILHPLYFGLDLSLCQLDLICRFGRLQYCVHFAPPTFWTWFVALSIHWDCHIIEIIMIDDCSKNNPKKRKRWGLIIENSFIFDNRLTLFFRRKSDNDIRETRKRYVIYDKTVIFIQLITFSNTFLLQKKQTLLQPTETKATIFNSWYLHCNLRWIWISTKRCIWSNFCSVFWICSW